MKDTMQHLNNYLILLWKLTGGATLIFDTQLVSVNGIYFDPDED